MNSCGSFNTNTKLRGLRNSETFEESPCNSQGSDIEKGDGGTLTSYGINDFNVPRGTLVICQRNSNNYLSDHSFSKFKPRYIFYFDKIYFFVVSLSLYNMILYYI